MIFIPIVVIVICKITYVSYDPSLQTCSFESKTNILIGSYVNFSSPIVEMNVSILNEATSTIGFLTSLNMSMLSRNFSIVIPITCVYNQIIQELKIVGASGIICRTEALIGPSRGAGSAPSNCGPQRLEKW